MDITVCDEELHPARWWKGNKKKCLGWAARKAAWHHDESDWMGCSWNWRGEALGVSSSSALASEVGNKWPVKALSFKRHHHTESPLRCHYRQHKNQTWWKTVFLCLWWWSVIIKHILCLGHKHLHFFISCTHDMICFLLLLPVFFQVKTLFLEFF